MKPLTSSPLILLIFANNRTAYLENIRKERQYLISLLQPTADSLELELKDLDYSTVEGVIELLNLQRERLALLHFAGHASNDLLHLDEGDAHSSGLATKLGECPNLKLAFFNGCNNSSLVQAIADAGIPNVVGTRQSIADETATSFSQGFFKALAVQGCTVAEAFSQAQADVQTLTGQTYRSLDLSIPPTAQDWAWFMRSQNPGWKLAEAANPCSRLPVLPHGELPPKPFKNLYYYTEADAEIFFGRCRALLDVLQLLDKAKEPVLLLHGGTGIGKSSFLLAGLIPRLKAPSRQQSVHYVRFNELNTQQDLLLQLFGSIEPASIRTRLSDSNPNGLPTIWILDQVEEVFLAHEHSQDFKVGIPSNLDALLSTLHRVFYPTDDSARPNTKLIISLRKEWFAELYDACRKHGINQYDHLLKPLDKPSIIEIIETPAEKNYLRQRYHLHIANPVDGRLSEQMADDLLTDKQSNIAPTLQIILSRLWERVENQHERVWDEILYLEEKRAGLLLDDYLRQQLQDIANKESWGKEAKDSGLLLDVLYNHTTPQGTAKTLTKIEYEILYPHISYRNSLLKALKNRHLIIEPQTGEYKPIRSQTRLAHDTLAQLIKIHFDESELPGQCLFRTISNHKKEKNTLLNEYELNIYKNSQNGTAALNQDDIKLIEKSLKKHKIGEAIQEIITITIFFFLLAMVFIFLKVALPWT